MKNLCKTAQNPYHGKHITQNNKDTKTCNLTFFRLDWANVAPRKILD